MSWRDELVGLASWRGVPFRTTDADLGVGRRNVLNEYPLRDTPYVDDLGRKARTYQVEGFVIGDDYLAQRDALVAAFEEPGPGELVHPRYGRVWVSLQGEARIREGYREQGMARFTVTFVEDSDNRQPAATTDTAGEVERTAADVDDAAADAFAADMDVDGPQVLADTVAEVLTADVDALRDLAQLFALPDSLGELTDGADALVGQLGDVLRSPRDLADELGALYLDVVADVRGTDGASAAHSGMMNGLQAVNAGGAVDLARHQAARAVAATAVPTTPARALLNDAARAELVRRLAITAQARLLAIAITDGAVATSADAVAWRDQVVAQIDVELEQADPDAATAWALSKLRAAVVRDVAERAELLKQRSTFTTVAVLPAVVLAHRVYQDATRTDELVARNGVRHPGFVPAGPVEVLL